LHLVPLKRATSKCVIQAFYNIFCRFGFIRSLTSDRGSFISHEFNKFLHDYGIKQILCSPYYPAGAVRRYFQALKRNLRAYFFWSTDKMAGFNKRNSVQFKLQ